MPRPKLPRTSTTQQNEAGAQPISPRKHASPGQGRQVSYTGRKAWLGFAQQLRKSKFDSDPLKSALLICGWTFHEFCQAAAAGNKALALELGMKHNAMARHFVEYKQPRLHSIEQTRADREAPPIAMVVAACATAEDWMALHGKDKPVVVEAPPGIPPPHGVDPLQAPNAAVSPPKVTRNPNARGVHDMMKYVRSTPPPGGYKRD